MKPLEHFPTSFYSRNLASNPYFYEKNWSMSDDFFSKVHDSSTTSTQSIRRIGFKQFIFYINIRKTH